MKYDFDEVIDRRNTDSVKWDGVVSRWGRRDLTPMWVADMDFRTPPFVIDALRKRLEHEVLGYTFACEQWYEAIMAWVRERYGWVINREMFTYTPGIVRGLAYLIQAMTAVGDKVMVMSPVYHPFFLVTEQNGRRVVRHSLLLEDGQYAIDFERFAREVEGCRLLLLSNPHNPGGRVWTAGELSRIADICHKCGTIVVSDEIHADLTLPGYKHRPFATVSEQARVNSVTFMSPSKAFNMPGLSSSYVIVENEEIRNRFFGYLQASELNEGHLFAYLSVAAAYCSGAEWLNQVVGYIQGNVDFTEEFLKSRIPAVGMIRPQAGYLIFLDCRGLGLSQPELEEFFAGEAGLALNSGTMFGPEGTGFMRLNVACPKAELQHALLKLEKAVRVLLSGRE